MLEKYEKTSQVSKGGIFMSDQYAIVPFVAQAKPRRRPKECELRKLSEQYGVHLLRFLHPLVQELHTTVDSRPLRTLVQTTEAILAFRDSTHGLLLSELGSYLDGLEAGGGGTKRLGTLIRHKKWKARQIDTFLWQKADDQVRKWEQQGEVGLVIWDGTVLEKPESLQPEGLCAVRSSKAVRLTQVKQGYYHPPGAPIFVPGMHGRSEEHTSELQSQSNLVCRLLLEKKKKNHNHHIVQYCYRMPTIYLLSSRTCFISFFHETRTCSIPLA